MSRGPHWDYPGIDVGSSVSNETAAGTQLPATATHRLVTDGGRDGAETDGGTSSFTGDDSSVSTDETPDRQPDPDIDLGELADLSRVEVIDILESLSKPKLIALITEFLDEDGGSRTDAATTESNSESTRIWDTTPEESAATEPPAEPSSQSDGPQPDDGEATPASDSPASDATPTPDSPASDTAPTPDNPASDATPTPDNPASDATWETEADYQRPPALDLSPGSTVLVQCGSQDDRKSAARYDLLGLSESDPRNVLLIQYRAMKTDELKSIADAAKRVKIISIGCSQSIPPSVEDTIETVEINNPNDVTRLGILATSTLDDWAPLDEQTVVSLDPLDVMLQYKTGEATFRFLHIFLGKLSSRGAISHYFVNPSSSDPQTVNTLKPLFNDVLTIDSVGVDVE